MAYQAMFHYRWHYRADIDLAGEILPRWRDLVSSGEEIAPRSQFIRDRQIGRLYVVGSNEVTTPVIEDSYKRFLKLLDEHIGNGPFLFGNRPSSADFGLYGQLTQLATFDPTPSKLTAETAPRVLAWVQTVDDLSGLEPTDDDWVDRDAVPATLTALLAEAGRTYVPALIANAKAVDTNAESVETEIDGRAWVQVPFPYQAKCLQWVRQEYARLDGADRQRWTGCLPERVAKRCFSRLFWRQRLLDLSTNQPKPILTPDAKQCSAGRVGQPETGHAPKAEFVHR